MLFLVYITWHYAEADWRAKWTLGWNQRDHDGGHQLHQQIMSGLTDKMPIHPSVSLSLPMVPYGAVFWRIGCEGKQSCLQYTMHSQAIMNFTHWKKRELQAGHQLSVLRLYCMVIQWRALICSAAVLLTVFKKISSLFFYSFILFAQNLLCCYVQSLIILIMFKPPQAPLFHQPGIFYPSVRMPLCHGLLTCSFISMKTNTGVWCNSVPHISSCCCWSFFCWKKKL